MKIYDQMRGIGAGQGEGCDLKIVMIFTTKKGKKFHEGLKDDEAFLFGQTFMAYLDIVCEH